MKLLSNTAGATYAFLSAWYFLHDGRDLDSIQWRPAALGLPTLVVGVLMLLGVIFGGIRSLTHDDNMAH